MNFRARRRLPCGFLKSGSGAYAEILLSLALKIPRTDDCAVIAEREVELVCEVNQYEDGFEKMLPVGAAADDMEKKIELCRCRKADEPARRLRNRGHQ